MASKKIVNGVICPHAPFLVPRSCWSLLSCVDQRISVSRWPPALQQHFATDSAPKKQSKYLLRKKVESYKRDHKVKHYGVPDSAEKLDTIMRCREFLHNGELAEVMRLYPVLIAEALLSPRDTKTIAQLVHRKIRGTRNRNFDGSGLLAFTNILVRDLQARRLPPESQAIVHLLSIYKETKEYESGVQLWQWLVQQNEEYVSQEIYGSAIELLAYQGEVPLSELEDLYATALKRFPDGFIEYHISPEAVLPDRSQPNRIRIKAMLLQGIITARLLHRDWRNAYIGLDVCLRLFPTQTPWRIFEVFLQERPYAEAFPVFMMACRSGLCPKPEALTIWLNAMTQSIKVNSISHCLLIVRGFAAALQGYVGAGGQLAPHLLGVVVKALDSMVPFRSFEQKPSENGKLVLECAEQLMSLFYYTGIHPTLPTLGTLITLAGKAGRADIFESATNMMTQNSTDRNPIQYRICLVAAGQLGSKSVLERVWQDIVDEAQARGYQLTQTEWVAFAYAGKVTRHVKYVAAQMEALSHTMTEEIQESIRTTLDGPTLSAKDNLREFDHEALELNLQQFMTTFNQVARMLQANDLQYFKDSSLPMILGPPIITASDEVLRAVYDKLTTVPDQPIPEHNSQTQIFVSTTGIPLADLRFANWKTINEILALAEHYEASRSSVLKQNMESGSPFDSVKFSQNLAHYYSDAEVARLTTIEKSAVDSAAQQDAEEQSVEDAINSVFDKRGRLLEPLGSQKSDEDVEVETKWAEVLKEHVEDESAVMTQVLRLRGRKA
ncbi:hypothetical protein EJ05DRAFT_541765 [Pseudovirgaria hyperparasitica]|uniref:Uncharacterized protein n=1 Tax=Pseudovirgaria hyperparasitica TaxID=470096 RepID=A0A6A6VVF7_9PEZI|nr:uncharacterized protein EJ05DRAFT_541765 [Pseudovirgaria hyperparasitica]KAF2753776.1 hypothetical protein EJ05DRAFT_541765 [Pseudovirgaria hyperparasitica]